jgi:transposase-like protein
MDAIKAKSSFNITFIILFILAIIIGFLVLNFYPIGKDKNIIRVILKLWGSWGLIIGGIGGFIWLIINQNKIYNNIAVETKGKIHEINIIEHMVYPCKMCELENRVGIVDLSEKKFICKQCGNTNQIESEKVMEFNTQKYYKIFYENKNEFITSLNSNNHLDRNKAVLLLKKLSPIVPDAKQMLDSINNNNKI